jgi:UDP-N-acetyl-D-glucosamine dehydrogenase
LDIIELLRERGAEVSYHDPFVPALQVGVPIARVAALEAGALDKFDCAVIATRHDSVDHRMVATHCKTVVDTRNALRGLKGAHVFRL